MCLHVCVCTTSVCTSTCVCFVSVHECVCVCVCRSVCTQVVTIHVYLSSGKEYAVNKTVTVDLVEYLP